LAQQLRFRRRRARGKLELSPGSRSSRYAEFYGELDPGARAWWFPPEALSDNQGRETGPGPRLMSRHAYLALAWRSGWRLSALMRLLLDREGPWDDRPADPAWSRQGRVG